MEYKFETPRFTRLPKQEKKASVKGDNFHRFWTIRTVMCKHILNAQVSIRAPCCRKWYDCAECHAEQEDHGLLQKTEMTFACKKCKKCFRKDTQEYEDCDEYCPHCDNHYVIEAKTPKAVLKVDGEDVRKDSRMLKDDRQRGDARRTIFDDEDDADRLG